MEESRTVNSAKNAISAVFQMALSTLIGFGSRTVFIYVLGEECLGLNGLFTTLLSLFSLAELGIGQAITYYMYKPIIENDHRRLAQLVRFYKLSYRIIGLTIAGIGIILIPALPYIINLENSVGYNVNILYLLYLANTVVTYLFFSYPQTVLSANQKQYIITNCSLIFACIGFAVDVLTLVLTHNYLIYLSAKLFVGVMSNLCIAIIAYRKYPYLKTKNADRMSISELRVMFKDVYAIFVVKLAAKLVDSTDNIFISIMFGTVLVGHNSNYVMIITAISGIVSSCIYACSGSVGNLVASSSKEVVLSRFNLLDYLNFIVSAFCAICLNSLLNPFITLIWGEGLLFSRFSVAMMCINFYIVSSLSVLFMFRQAMGLFRYYIYNQLFAAITNLVLNCVLGSLFGIEGIFLATVVANACLAVVPFVKNLFLVGFEMSYKSHLYVVCARGLFVCAIAVLIEVLCYNIPHTFLGFAVRTVIVVLVSGISLLLTGLKDSRLPSLWSYAKTFFQR